MPIQLRTGTSAAEHNLRKSWPFAPNPRAFRRLHEVLRTTAVVGSIGVYGVLTNPIKQGKGSQFLMQECQTSFAAATYRPL